MKKRRRRVKGADELRAESQITKEDLRVMRLRFFDLSWIKREHMLVPGSGYVIGSECDPYREDGNV